MAMDSRFHEVEPMLGERVVHEQPTDYLGLLKIVRIACWTEVVHVNFLELDR